MAHEVEKPGELVSYRNRDRKTVSYYLPFGEDLAKGVSCAFCGEKAVVQHTMKPVSNRDYSCLSCNAHYKDVTPEGLAQGRIEHIVELRRRMEEAERLKKEYKTELMRGGAIFEDPAFNPANELGKPRSSGLGVAGAVKIAAEEVS